MILFLDDAPERAALMYQRMTQEDANNTMWCQTADECIGVLTDYKDELNLVYLDHDLGGTQYQDSKADNCGMEVVRFLEKQNSQLFNHVEFVVHSWNIEAGKRMNRRLLDAGYKTCYIPFGTTSQVEV